MAWKRTLTGTVIAAGLVAGSSAAPALAAAAHHRAHPTSAHSAGSVSANPARVTETTKGNVSFTLVGKGLIPDTKYKVDANTLSVDCKNSFNAKTVATDLKGVFNLSGTAGPNCIAGTFLINVQETSSPFTIYSAKLTLSMP